MALTEKERRDQKQERARARRRADTVDQALQEIYKPIEEWDEEELARGRPRDRLGGFKGRSPKWMTVALHEQAVKQFTDRSRSHLRGLVPLALATIQMLLTSEEVDEKGRYIVPAGVKLDAAKWTVEHLVGKPTQRTEMDISVRLQAILGAAMVMPGSSEAVQQALDTSSRSLREARGNDDED